MIKRLTDKTPKKPTLIWLLMTMLYVLSIIINEHFELLEAFQFSNETISIIKIIGVFGYILTTVTNFIQTPKRNDTSP